MCVCVMRWIFLFRIYLYEAMQRINWTILLWAKIQTAVLPFCVWVCDCKMGVWVFQKKKTKRRRRISKKRIWQSSANFGGNCEKYGNLFQNEKYEFKSIKWSHHFILVLLNASEYLLIKLVLTATFSQVSSETHAKKNQIPFQRFRFGQKSFYFSWNRKPIPTIWPQILGVFNP